MRGRIIYVNNTDENADDFDVHSHSPTLTKNLRGSGTVLPTGTMEMGKRVIVMDEIE